MKLPAVCFMILVILFDASLAAAADGVIESRESEYNSIYVIRRGREIAMTFGKNATIYVESSTDVADPTQLPAEYTRLMTIPFAYTGPLRTVLEIGLGGGSTASYIRRTFPDVKMKTVELDPVVAELAAKYFGLKVDQNLSIEIQDGRLYLQRNNAKYDAILVDAYRGPFVPFHLLTKEFFTLVKSRLEPGGVVAQNVEPTTMLYDAAIATMRSVFDNVDVYPAAGNYVVVGYDGPRQSDEDLARRAKQADATFHPRYSLVDLAKMRLPPADVSAKVLTDDFAPVEMLKALRRHNRKQPQ